MTIDYSKLSGDEIMKLADQENAVDFGESQMVISSKGEWMMLVGVVQLALRHPDLPPTTKSFTLNWATKVIDHLTQGRPATRELMVCGFDPRYDE